MRAIACLTRVFAGYLYGFRLVDQVQNEANGLKIQRTGDKSAEGGENQVTVTRHVFVDQLGGPTALTKSCQPVSCNLSAGLELRGSFVL